MKINHKYFLFINILLFLIIISSCSNNVVFEQSVPINEKAWNYHDKLSFPLKITDNKQAYDLIINLKHKENYKYSNVFFFVDIVGPTETFRDTIECVMANWKGKWLGDTQGDEIAHHFRYRTNTVFPEIGNYTVRLEQAMRDTSLQAITAIGLQLNKYQAK